MEIDFAKMQEAVDKQAKESKTAFDVAMDRMMKRAQKDLEEPYRIIVESLSEETNRKRGEMELEAEAASERARQEVEDHYVKEHPALQRDQPSYKALRKLAEDL